MPILDGFEATARIRQREEGSGRRTPIVALTARALSGDAELCLQAGMDDYVSKPFRPAELLQAVGRNLPEDRATAAPAVAPASVDRDQVMEFVEGDVGLLDELVSFIRQSAPEMVREIQDLPAADVEGLISRAHALKNAVGVVGTNEAHASAFALEKAAREGRLEDREQLIASCSVNTDALIEQLTALVAEAEAG